MPDKQKAKFVQPMLLLRTEKLPEGPEWLYQLKMDGYRAVAYKTAGKLYFRSRNNNDFALRYPSIASALADLPNETVIDGEVVAFDESGKPSFNTLQNHGSSGVPLVFYVFDLMMLAGRDVTQKSLDARLALLQKQVLPKLDEPIRYLGELDAALSDLIKSVEVSGLEGLVAKRRTGKYEAGLRSGAWLKMRVNRGQEFVIGGYTFGGATFDALIFGYYEGDKLLYAARTRNGFTPAIRADLMKRFQKLLTDKCPFDNLPEAKSGRWGAGLTAAKMKDCAWLKPKLVGRFEYLEWTPENHLRHTRFIALRDDKTAKDVRCE